MYASQTTSPKPAAPTQTDPPGESPPRHAPRAVRRLAAILLVSLGGCGGGSEPNDSASVASSSRTATVFPARQGLMLVDQSARGSALRQSMPTDHSGLASFDAATAGSRLLATATDTGWHVPLRRSARLLGDGQTLELTPLTTIFDEFVETGLSEAEARTRVYDLLASACAVTTQTLPYTSMYGDHPLDEPAREWLLAALDAYIDALGRLGLSPDTPGINWPHLLGTHVTLLAQLCGTARTVHSGAWLAAAADTLANRHGLAAHVANRAVGALRPRALALVLDRVADRIALLEHPSLSATLETQTPTWIGNQPGQVANLIDAAVARSMSGGVAAADMAGIELDRQGRIVQAISGQTTWVDADSPPVRFVNRAAETRSVRLALNGVALDSMADLIFETLALPAEQADEPLQRRAWRYTVRRSAHSSPVTGGIFQHQAELYLRSVGRGLCDDVAHTLALMWQAMGHGARVTWLSGHVVPEVLVDGRWELYDPDFRVYYLNRQGQVASVVDIQNDGTLMTSPLLRIAGALDGSYDALLAAIYLSVDDNHFDSSLMYASAAPFDPALDLPAGATLEFRGEGAIAVPTVEPGAAVDAASLKLQLPLGFTGTVRLPHVLTDVVGDGRVVWLSQTADVPPEGLAASIMNRYQATPSVGIATIDVERVGPQGLTLTMMVNPSLAPHGATLSAHLTGPSVGGIEVNVSP